MIKENQSVLNMGLTEKLWSYTFLTVISFVFLLIHSTSVSPLYIGSDFDSTVFILMGKFFLDGKIPYIEYFDHKGPVIIFFEAFAQLLSSDERTGAYILLSIFLAVSLIFIYKTCRMYLSVGYSFSVILFTLCFYALTLNGGNRTEDISLPFLYIPLFFTAQFLRDKERKIKPLHFFIIGICTAILFWLRLNNMACICAWMMFIVIVIIKKHDWKGLGALILYTFIGFLAITLPIIIYFYHINALEEMLYAGILFNFKYAEYSGLSSNDSFSLYLFLRGSIAHIFPFLILIIGTIAIYIKTKNKEYILLAILSLIFGILGTQIGIRSSYYMTIVIPFLVLGAIFIISSIKYFSKNKKLSYILNITFIIMLIGASAFKQIEKKDFNKNETIYSDASNSIIKDIPSDERSKIYTYKTSVKFYFYTKLQPYFRYFMSQDRHGNIDNQIFSDINLMMKDNPPKWIVIEDKDSREPNPDFFKILDKDYFLYNENDFFNLYKHK